MALTVDKKSAIISEARRAENDTGSPEVQVSILTQRILDLTQHVREHKHDFHSRRGLVMMVAKRNRHLKYLARTNRLQYLALIKRLGLRK